MGDGAAVWEQLVDGTLEDSALTPELIQILEEMEAMGIASTDTTHPARVVGVDPPWLSSPLHEIVYSILGRVADDNGVEVVFIKGPVLKAQGLRTREHSGDVDCWVEPGTDVRLARAMQPWGWQPAMSAFTSTPVLHSLTLRAPTWGCAVDVHGWFPGMTISAEEAFGEVFRSAELHTFAGYTVKTPGPPMHAVISALHDVRPFGSPTSRESVVRAARVLERGGEDTVRVAATVGAQFALKDAFAEAFPALTRDWKDAPVPIDWEWRSQRTMLRAYVAALRTLPPSQRIRTVYRILWPTAESLQAGPISRDSGDLTVRQLRSKRMVRGFQELLASLRRGRRP
ncbi:hypothetical protein ACFC14_10085 [Microbacterium sp. NPDC055988]|uniref:hypothetical protein n=1 Tax=Microbacterium sp. NPDC055988 TaxID=3345671 RepID=UPI0035E2D2AA